MRTLTNMRLHSFVAALLAVVLTSSSALACGPFTLEAVFVHTVHPDYPLERFASGRMGVVQPSYARSYLYVAYRYLQGSPFTAEEQKALTELWKDRLNLGWSAGDEEWVKSWLAARRTVVATDPAAPISVYRNREKPNEYESFMNCQKDSFDTAIATLNERIAKYGAVSAAVKTWVEGQDQVFSNCAGGSSIPAELPADADALLRADRAYQIAAANFYATNFDEAQQRFAAIAADSGSPWQQNAVYLVARSLARKGSLGPAEQKQESLDQAEAQLQKILADRKLTSLHAPSVRLLNLVSLRAHPVERMHELAQILSSKTADPNLKQDLWDYTTLLDGFFDGDQAKLQALPRDDDLTDWIATLQVSDDATREHAIARWQATHSTAWLINALTKVPSYHSKARELIAAAEAVPNNSPGFVSARFHAIRLLTEEGNDAAARRSIAQILNTARAQLDESSLNLFVAHQRLLATSLDEFLAEAGRVPATLSWDDDGRQIPAEPSEISAESKDLAGKPLFDQDVGDTLNRQLPLSLLKQAVSSNVLPAHLRRDVAQAAWLRAILLDDMKTADDLAPAVSTMIPELAPMLNDYLSATRPDEKKFAAIYLWLKSPGLEPIVDVGIGRQTPPTEQDSLRDNWWCSAAYTAAVGDDDSVDVEAFTGTGKTSPRFLSAADLQRAKLEWESLMKLGAAPNYISKTVIEWANRNPDDSRVPEALHLAVKTSRYGCGDADTGRWSKAAFDLLHRKYPASPWAKKTPYWFKG
jgi:hypothetical protein